MECHRLTEANIEDIIRTFLQLKEGTQVEFFKRKNRSGLLEFTGTINVVFQDTESLQQAVRDKVKIGDRHCSVAKWEHTVKVRHCYTCTLSLAMWPTDVGARQLSVVFAICLDMNKRIALSLTLSFLSLNTARRDTLQGLSRA